MTQPRAARGERRVVTALFCDVAGSTTMAERLDPEEWGGHERGVRPPERPCHTLRRYRASPPRRCPSGFLWRAHSSRRRPAARSVRRAPHGGSGRATARAPAQGTRLRVQRPRWHQHGARGCWRHRLLGRDRVHRDGQRRECRRARTRSIKAHVVRYGKSRQRCPKSSRREATPSRPPLCSRRRARPLPTSPTTLALRSCERRSWPNQMCRPLTAGRTASASSHSVHLTRFSADVQARSPVCVSQRLGPVLYSHH